jgi:Transposase
VIAQPVYVGADMAKPTIDLYAAGLAVAPSIENAPAGYRLLLKSLGRSSRPVHVICEATGVYHQRFVAALQQAGVTVSVVNPRQARDFARSRNWLAELERVATFSDFRNAAIAAGAGPAPATLENRRLGFRLLGRDFADRSRGGFRGRGLGNDAGVLQRVLAEGRGVLVDFADDVLVDPVGLGKHLMLVIGPGLQVLKLEEAHAIDADEAENVTGGGIVLRLGRLGELEDNTLVEKVE